MINALAETQFRLMKYGDNGNMFLFEELRIPIKELCMEFDSPELYERFMMNAEKAMLFRKEKIFIEPNNDKTVKADL